MNKQSKPSGSTGLNGLIVSNETVGPFRLNKHGGQTSWPNASVGQPGDPMERCELDGSIEPGKSIKLGKSI